MLNIMSIGSDKCKARINHIFINTETVFLCLSYFFLAHPQSLKPYKQILYCFTCVKPLLADSITSYDGLPWLTCWPIWAENNSKNCQHQFGLQACLWKYLFIALWHWFTQALHSTISREMWLNYVRKVTKNEPRSKSVKVVPLQVFSSGFFLGLSKW